MMKLVIMMIVVLVVMVVVVVVINDDEDVFDDNEFLRCLATIDDRDVFVCVRTVCNKWFHARGQEFIRPCSPYADE